MTLHEYTQFILDLNFGLIHEAAERIYLKEGYILLLKEQLTPTRKWAELTRELKNNGIRKSKSGGFYIIPPDRLTGFWRIVAQSCKTLIKLY